MFAGIGILGIVVFIRADLRDRRLAKAGADQKTRREEIAPAP